jgi:hypothetical protein
VLVDKWDGSNEASFVEVVKKKEVSETLKYEASSDDVEKYIMFDRSMLLGSVVTGFGDVDTLAVRDMGEIDSIRVVDGFGVKVGSKAEDMPWINDFDNISSGIDDVIVFDVEMDRSSWSLGELKSRNSERVEL